MPLAILAATYIWVSPSSLPLRFNRPNAVIVSMETVEGEIQKTFEKDGSVAVTLAGLIAEGFFAMGIVNRVIILD